MNELELDKIQSIFFCYLDTILSFVSSLLGFLCFIIFLDKKFSSNFYNYKRIEILFSWIAQYFYGLRFFYYCKLNDLNQKYSSILIQLINRYVRDVFESISSLFCIYSSLYFYLMLINMEKSKYNLLSRVSYIKICFISFIMSSLLFLYRTLDHNIVATVTNSSIKINNSNINSKYVYQPVKTSFYANIFYHINRIASFFITDGVLVLILLIINLLIYIKIKKSMNMKKVFHNNKSSSSQHEQTKSSIKTCENSIKLIVFVNSLNQIIGKLPMIVYHTADTILDSNKFVNKVFLVIFTFSSYTLLAISYICCIISLIKHLETN